MLWHAGDREDADAQRFFEYQTANVDDVRFSRNTINRVFTKPRDGSLEELIAKLNAQDPTCDPATADCLVLDACVRKNGVARTGQSQAALGPRTCRKHERPAHVRLKVWHFHERMLGRNWLPVGTSGGTGGRRKREQTN